MAGVVNFRHFAYLIQVLMSAISDLVIGFMID